MLPSTPTLASTYMIVQFSQQKLYVYIYKVTLHQEFSTLKLACRVLHLHIIVKESNGCGDTENAPERYNRDHNERPRFIQPHIHSLETRGEMETNHRPFFPKQMDTANNLLRTIYLQDTYFQVPIHKDSRKYLRFVWEGPVHQFTALCFSLSTAPQVFTRLMVPVSSKLHSSGVSLLRYQDD